MNSADKAIRLIARFVKTAIFVQRQGKTNFLSTRVLGVRNAKKIGFDAVFGQIARFYTMGISQ